MFSGRRLKVRLSLIIAVLTFILALSINHLVSQLSRAQIEQDQSALLEQAALTMMSRLDQDLSARGGEIKFLAQRDAIKDPNVPLARKQAILEGIRKSYPYYAWIGVTDAQGNILAGTDGILVGKNVAKRDWFLLGSQDIHFGDAHDAFLLAKLMPKPKWDDLPLRLVDVSAPLYDDDGKLLGVICGHLSLDWAFEARTRILDQLSKQKIDLIVLNRDGKVLMGTPELPSLAVDLSSLKTLNNSKQHGISTQIETWPDGKSYLTTAVKEQGFADYPGMGWTVVARKLEATAFATATQVSWTIAGLTALGALAFILVVSGIISRQLRPLEQISEAAEHIKDNDLTIALPQPKGNDELSVLARSLSDLVTRLQENNAEMHLASRVFEDSGQGIIITDAQRNIVRVNAAFINITGYSEEEAIGQNPRLLSSGQHTALFYRTIWESVNQTGSWKGEIWNRHKSGHLFPEWLSIHALSNEAGIITNYIGIFDDISDKKNAEQRLTHLANYDVLTDLPNRHLMQNQAQSMIEHSIELKQHLGLIFIDLDKFKHINDSLGHPVGDQVLLETATRFKQETSPNMLLSRWGGDEFIVVIPNASHLIVSTLVKRLINSLQRPFILAGQKHYLGLSAGISLFPQDGQTVEQLLRCADTAMYQAKHEGANLYRFYEGGMHADVERFMQLDNGLRHAIAAEGEGLRMVFQPQYSNDGKTLISAEALIRWQDETLGFISPAEFIPIAEETGQIIPLGYWIVKEVARHYQQLSQLGCHLVPISINCSAHQLAEPELASNIHKMLLHYDVPSQHVMIEVTESAVMRNETLALKALAELKSFGYRISIDDFGTGYSCLSYIQKISPAEIKIDQRFVGSMTTENDSRNIVHFTHGLAHSMGIDVVAEGVETEAQLIALQAIGDIKIQGYLLSRPLAFEAFAALLTTKEA